MVHCVKTRHIFTLIHVFEMYSPGRESHRRLLYLFWLSSTTLSSLLLLLLLFSSDLFAAQSLAGECASGWVRAG